MARLLFSIDGIEYRFVSEYPNPTDPGDDAIIDNVSPPLTYSDYYLVVSGTMSRTGRRPARSDPPNVVLKIARNDSDVEFLALEHHTYAQKLASLQGTWIPRYHGFYANESVRGTEQHWRPPACILMDYCGLSMTALSDQDRPLRDTDFDMQLVGAVEALHDLGFVHGNLNADHVLNHDGRPKLVGFTHLTQETCARKLPVVRGAIHPTFAAFNCSELYHLCVDMDVWRPRAWRFSNAPLETRVSAS
ncbi:hypothetical protein OF83DRAFT_1114656 [Amylostereum chailletii]|nr:hypothetical protein OF83DRAFT_1114656 [Amylostereum chailletii]